MGDVNFATSDVIDRTEIIWHKRGTDKPISGSAMLSSTATTRRPPPRKSVRSDWVEALCGQRHTGTVRIVQQNFDMLPGTVVKVTKGKLHSVNNTVTTT